MPISKDRLERARRRLAAEAAAAGGSPEEYIKKMLEAARAAALEKSRTREEPAVPMVDDTEAAAAFTAADADRYRKYALDALRGKSPFFAAFHNPMYNGVSGDAQKEKFISKSDPNKARIAFLMMAKDLDDEAKAYETGAKRSVIPGASCIYTATDNYGRQYRVSGNQTFAANPEKYGFIQIPAADVQPGDILQDLDPAGIPRHAITLDGYDSSGKPLFNYSNGDSAAGAIRTGKHYFSGDIPSEINAYRFVGTPADSTRWRQEFESGQLSYGDGGFIRSFDDGGPVVDPDAPDKDSFVYPIYTQQWSKKLPPELQVEIPYALPWYYRQKDGSYDISGFSNETNAGYTPAVYYYTKEKYPGIKYYKNPQNELFVLKEAWNPSLNLSGYTELTADEARAMLPKRDYIGGENYRLETAKRIPGFIDAVREKAELYGVDPNLLLHRVLREGFIDSLVHEYNRKTPALKQKTFFDDVMRRPVSGFHEFGLDDAGSNLLSGRYSLKTPSVKWELRNETNEKGRDVQSVATSNVSDALEIKAADMAYRQQELAKRGLIGNKYVNAAYNAGLNSPHLTDEAYMANHYSVPDYGVFYKGGNMNKYDGLSRGSSQMNTSDDDYLFQIASWHAAHPGQLWSDTPEASSARQWLAQNRPDDFASMYWAEDEETRKNIDPRLIPERALERSMEDAVRTRDAAAPYVAGALAAPVVLGEALSAVPFIPSVPGAVANAARTAGQFVSSPAGMQTIGQFVTPLLGGAAYDAGIRAYTPYNSAGDWLYRGRIPFTNTSPETLLQDASPFIQGMAQSASELLANPMYYLPYGSLASGAARLPERFASRNAVRSLPDAIDMTGYDYARPIATSTDDAVHDKLEAARRLQEELDASSASPGTGSAFTASERSSSALPTYRTNNYALAEGPSVHPASSVNALSGIGELSSSSTEDLMRAFDSIRFSPTPGASPERTRLGHELRRRARQAYGLPEEGGTAADLANITDDQLLSLIRDHRTYDSLERYVNYGLTGESVSSYSTADLSGEASRRLRQAGTHGYNNLSEVERDVALMSASHDYHITGPARNRIFRAAEPLVDDAIMSGSPIPTGLARLRDIRVEKLYNDGRIPDTNPYFQEMLQRDRQKIESEDIGALLRSNFYFNDADDNSREALRSLKRAFPGKKLSELFDMLHNLESQPETIQRKISPIIKEAYVGPGESFGSLSRYDAKKQDIARGVIEDMLYKDTGKHYAIKTILDPEHPDYIGLAEYLRSHGMSVLPGDISHLSWFQVARAAENGLSTEEATLETAIQTELLQRAMPRQTAIAEQNTSPNSLKVMIKGAARAPGGYGTGPGQTSIVQLSNSPTSGNNLQLNRLVSDDLGNLSFTKITDSDDLLFNKNAARKLFTFVDSNRYNPGGFKQFLQDNPDMIPYVDKILAISDRLNAFDYKDISAALNSINRRYGEALSLPEKRFFGKPSSSPDFYTNENLSKILYTIQDFDRGTGASSFGTEGYATLLDRYPIITLKHKYGGKLKTLVDKYGYSVNGKPLLETVRKIKCGGKLK